MGECLVFELLLRPGLLLLSLKGLLALADLSLFEQWDVGL